MSAKFELSAKARTHLGKSASRRLRRLENCIPAVVYGGGENPTSLTIAHDDAIHALANEAFYSHVLSLDINDKKEKVILKGLQRHPFKPKVLHMDFLRVKANEKISMNVPLHFLNEDKAKGVKQGGIIAHLQTEIEISCLPEALPEFIAVDLIHLTIDETIPLSAITLPAGVTLSSDRNNNQPVVSIHLPRAAVEASATEETTDNADTTTDKPTDT